ncbi:MAG: hypothetical protein C0626_02105 [Arcobacter sp.]|nr:MAG: hypothetical protein C0626_02105 [Arcobacter sp.]
MRYNMVPLSINNGLDNKKIAGSFDYIILMKAPANANVRIRLNDNTASEIPLNVNFAISAKDVTEIFVSADVVEDGAILIGQSDTIENFQILTSPVVSQIDTIGSVAEVTGFSSALLTALDKISNPYDFKEIIKGNYNLSPFSTLLDTTLDCDRVDIILSSSNLGHSTVAYTSIYCEIDGAVVAKELISNIYSINDVVISLPNVRGMNIKVKGNSSNTYGVIHYTLIKYDLKA